MSAALQVELDGALSAVLDDMQRSLAELADELATERAALLAADVPAIDAAGTMYANSEDGNVYAIDADGSLQGRLLLDTALGASYTPVTLDYAGRIYALNAGPMYVVGAN